MANDPLNPAHYDGTACAAIGECLSGNSYQVLKYNWRLGKKDDPLIDVGKSIWYLDREINLSILGRHWKAQWFPSPEWFATFLVGVDPHVETVAALLINWNRTGDPVYLGTLRSVLVQERAKLETAATGQQTMEI